MNEEELTQVIDTYNSYLERMTAAVTHLCEDLEESNYSELSPVVPSLIEGWGWITDAADSFVRFEKLAENTYHDYQNLLKNLGEAMENKDYILFHDLLEFEMLPALVNLRIAEADIN